MGDFRADIKIKMHLIDKNYEMDSWINYWPEDYSGVDRSVREFFEDAWEDAKGRYDRRVAKIELEKNKEEIEKEEKAQLERLKKKYEKQNQ
jgi:hypothetical protein